jgi:DNA-binding MarR family transcriptional regulator
MPDKSFFKPTNLYKEYMILDLIEKYKDITQRELASHLGIAVSMVNVLLDRIEKEGNIKRKKYSSKTVEYLLTKKGCERRKLLNIGYLNSTQKLYDSAKDNIYRFLDQIAQKKIKKILLYGAGEVAEILLNTIVTDSRIQIKILAFIDDDVLKHGKFLMGIKIVSINEIADYEYDGIFVSSYKNQQLISDKLKKMNINEKIIFHFFK